MELRECNKCGENVNIDDPRAFAFKAGKEKIEEVPCKVKGKEHMKVERKTPGEMEFFHTSCAPKELLAKTSDEDDE